MTSQTFFIFDLEKLKEISKRIFSEKVIDVYENYYSSVCAYIKISGNNISMQEIRSLDYYGYKVNTIISKNTSLDIHLNLDFEKIKELSKYE